MDRNSVLCIDVLHWWPNLIKFELYNLPVFIAAVLGCVVWKINHGANPTESGADLNDFAWLHVVVTIAVVSDVFDDYALDADASLNLLAELGSLPTWPTERMLYR